jgi:hypothetical protein
MAHRKTPKRKTVRRKHRGGYYGASGAIAPGAMQWSAGSEMGQWAGDMSSRGGNGKVQYGRGRTRKGKRHSRRKHRGGGKFGGVSASFMGSGSRGLADYGGVVTREPIGTAAGGAFNDMAAGAYKSGTSYLRN